MNKINMVNGAETKNDTPKNSYEVFYTVKMYTSTTITANNETEAIEKLEHLFNNGDLQCQLDDESVTETTELDGITPIYLGDATDYPPFFDC